MILQVFAVEDRSTCLNDLIHLFMLMDFDILTQIFSSMTF